ncbi:cytochrome C biogenesis protein [Rhodoplanes elegans]|uniref:Cytochrome C biogenesis protein n=1 Tax=Rhodoplanes elegans TaxID=29408 RepID=A0A327JXU9_9BRAD|nr:cytochrome c biogenesis protein CcdA [Rhodoplanes elegans]MBK5956904.1 cytochrome C biogenesis protein [Rhodoplanes elegans]RAI30414.1 cytochrome C biogenesis protein [Rhodoplanes elegans]
MSLEVGFAAAALAGLLSFLSPCVLPLVPPYLTWLAGASLDELAGDTPRPGTTARAFLRALFFVAGFSAVFIALGASASLLGRLLTDHLTLLSRVAGVIIVVLGLHFVGLIRIPLLYREARFGLGGQSAGLFGAFVMGLAFAFGWTPCVGPVLASILLIAGAEDSAGQGAGLLAAYAAGIGLPFLTAALFVRPFLGFLKRFRGHLGAVEKVIGGLLIITGVLIFTGTMADIAGWLLETVPALGRIG